MAKPRLSIPKGLPTPYKKAYLKAKAAAETCWRKYNKCKAQKKSLSRKSKGKKSKAKRPKTKKSKKTKKRTKKGRANKNNHFFPY